MARGLAGFTQGAKVALFVAVLVAASYFVYRMVAKDSASGGGYTVYTHLKDATVGLQLSKKFSLLVGHFKPPVSQEFLTSASKADFIERALVSSLAPP